MRAGWLVRCGMINGQLKMVAMALALGVGVAGCGKRERIVDVGTRDGVLHIGNSTEPTDLDPQVVTGRPESQVIMALFEGLVNYDPVDLHPVPGVAESWDISADGLVYTFHLREAARWSDGAPVTAEDFVRSWKRILTPSLASEYAYMLFCAEGAEAWNRGEADDFSKVGFRAVDARTLEVRLERPTSYFLSLLCHYAWFPVPIDTVAKFDGLERKGTAWTRVKNIVCNGAFVLTEWQPNQRIVVEKSPTYWDRDAVKLSGVAFYPVENVDTEERMFRAGQLHITSAVPLSKIDWYRERNPGLLHIDPTFATMYLRANVKRDNLADPRVRRALALAIDRVTLTTKINRGGKFPAYALTPPGAAGFEPPKGFADDLPEARRLLEEAGHAGGAGLGRIGMLYPTSDNGKLIAEAIQGMWRSGLGVDVQLENQEWKVFLDSMNTGNYDLAISIWGGDYAEPSTFLDLMVTDGGNNRTGWSNDEYDRLVRESLETRDEAARLAIYTRLEEILAAEAPVFPVYINSAVKLIDPAVHGWHPTLLDRHPFRDVWLESSMPR